MVLYVIIALVGISYTRRISNSKSHIIVGNHKTTYIQSTCIEKSSWRKTRKVTLVESYPFDVFFLVLFSFFLSIGDLLTYKFLLLIVTNSIYFKYLIQFWAFALAEQQKENLLRSCFSALQNDLIDPQIQTVPV